MKRKSTLSTETSLRVLILGDKDFGVASQKEPDLQGIWRILREQGIDCDRWPASAFPWNPFGSGATALRGLDPLRIFKVLLRQWRYQLIICVFEASAVGPSLLRRLGLIRRPVILWDFAAGTNWRLRVLFQRVIFPNVDGILCLNSCQMRVADELTWVPGRAELVGYDVDTAYFNPRFSEDGTYALTVGNDCSRDYAILLDAIQSCSVPLKICTNTSLQLSPTQQADTTIINCSLTYEGLRELYGRAKFVVLPLKNVRHPGGITTLVEAMSMGKPIICSNSAGIRDFLLPGENAIVVPPGDREALTAAIKRLDNDSNERARLGTNARRYAEEMLSIRVVAERMRGALLRFL
jgi:glycosyltransferase involved in cell wall biosynthesis